jgi:hypothetical protein
MTSAASFFGFSSFFLIVNKQTTVAFGSIVW